MSTDKNPIYPHDWKPQSGNVKYCRHGAVLENDSDGCFKCGTESRQAQIDNLAQKLQEEVKKGKAEREARQKWQNAFTIERREKMELRAALEKAEAELARIRQVAERLRNSNDENEISLEENIAGKYMIKVLDGENFQ